MGMRISSHSISTMELSQPPAQHQNPLHQLSQGSAQQSFHIPDEIQVPRTGDTLGFSALFCHSFHHLKCRALPECELLDQVHIL